MQDQEAIAIACADLHLDENAWKDRSEIHGDSMWSLKWICDLAQERRLPVIMAGDVLDKQLNNAAVTRSVRYNLAKVGRTIMYVQGQHDMQPLPWLSSLNDENTSWLDFDCRTMKRPSSIPGVGIWGIDWTPANKIQDRLNEIPKDTDILVMHQVTKDLMKELRELKHWELQASQIPHARLLILGDFHRTRIVKTKGATGQDLTIISPGSTNMRSIDEPPDKYVFLINRHLEYEKVRIPTRPKLEFTIKDEVDFNYFVGIAAVQLEGARKQALKDGVPEHISKPLQLVKFNSSIPYVYRRITEAVGDYGHLFTDVIGSTENPDETPEDESEVVMSQGIKEFGPSACLHLCVDKEKDPKAYNLLSRVLEEKDYMAVLMEERSKYINESKDNQEHPSPEG
jgi:predicted phosphodiesterase